MAVNKLHRAGDEVRVRMSATDKAHAALGRLRLERVITMYDTNFQSNKELGFTPQVSVWIEAQDELAMERVRRRVLSALDPFLKGAAVTVYPRHGLRDEDRGD
jgi:hypothetical protein